VAVGRRRRRARRRLPFWWWCGGAARPLQGPPRLQHQLPWPPSCGRGAWERRLRRLFRPRPAPRRSCARRERAWEEVARPRPPRRSPPSSCEAGGRGALARLPRPRRPLSPPRSSCARRRRLAAAWSVAARG
jgi:hypothetical protein